MGTIGFKEADYYEPRERLVLTQEPMGTIGLRVAVTERWQKSSWRLRVGEPATTGAVTQASVYEYNALSPFFFRRQ